MGKKQKKEALILRQQEIVSAAKSAGRQLTAEEVREFDEAQTEIDRLTREIAAEEPDGAGQPPANGQRSQEPAVGAPAASDPTTGERSAAEERQRIMEISDLCREFGMEGSQTREFIQNGESVDMVRAAVLKHVRQNGAPIGSRATVVGDAEDKRRSAITDALLLRGGVELESPAPGAQEFRGMSLRDIGISCLEEAGERGAYTRSSEEIYNMLMRGYFNPSAAFPSIMDQTINKAYVEGHRSYPATFDQWTKAGSLSDFKTHDNNYLAGPVGEFLEVPEGGELKHDTPKEDKMPTRKLRTYGRQFTLTRQAFINDDIGLITGLPARYAASARKTLNKQCYQILVNNPAVYDGVPLFGSAHKNLIATGTGITMEAMQGMIMALTNQKDQFGEPCVIRPAYLIVPSGYEFTVYTLFESPTINTTDNTQAVNPLFQYRNSIKIIADPTINALCGGLGKQMPWWLVGDSMDTAFMEVDYLNGQKIPTIRRMESAGQLGFVWDIYLDWGISVMDYRGAIKNPGIVVDNPIKLA